MEWNGHERSMDVNGSICLFVLWLIGPFVIPVIPSLRTVFDLVADVT